MNGYERFEVGEMGGKIPVLLWQCREEIVLQRPRHDDRNSNLLLLDCCEVARAHLTSNPSGGIVAICWPTISIEVYKSAFEPHRLK